MSNEPTAEDGRARIPVRTRQLAMDWSLVLISQGIASTILRPQDGSGWGLLVERADYTQAIRALRLTKRWMRGAIVARTAWLAVLVCRRAAEIVVGLATGPGDSPRHIG